MRLPHDDQAEESVIGAVLLAPRMWPAVSGILQAEDFYSEELAAIWKAIAAVDAGGTPPDQVAVIAELRRRKAPTTPLRVRDICEQTPAPASAPHYAQIVARMAAQRRLIFASQETIEQAAGDLSDPAQLVAQAMDRIAAAHWRGTGDMLSATEIVDAAIEEMEREEQVGDERVRTGIGKLDGVLGGGLKPGRFTIIAARPSVGKSALAGNIVLRALRNGTSTLFVSLEMTGREIIERLVTDAFELDPAQKGAAMSALVNQPEIHQWPLAFRERADLAGMIAAVREGSYGLVVLDYIQLLPTNMRFENRQLEVAHIARSLKLLAMNSRVPVLACAQLARRKDEGKKSSVPRLSDLRESGAQEQDADVVILLDRDSEAGEPETKLIVAKNRHGRTGSVDLTFDDGRTRFRERSYAGPAAPQHPAAAV